MVANSLRKEAEKELTDLRLKPNNQIILMKFIWKDFESGRCIRGKDGKLGFSEKDRERIWKNHDHEQRKWLGSYDRR